MLSTEERIPSPKAKTNRNEKRCRSRSARITLTVNNGPAELRVAEGLDSLPGV
jgi:hypothetical protein